jgi:integrase
MSSKRQETQRVNAIVAKFGTYSLSAVTPAIISEWRKELEKKPLAPQTVHTYMSVLGRLYKAAAIDFGIPLPLGNPVESARKPTVRNERDRILDANEERRLLEALGKARGKHLKPITLLAMETAMRRGEIMDLRWEHIDLKKQTAFLPKTVNQRPIVSRCQRPNLSSLSG